MTLRLVPPSLAGIAGYVVALEASWSLSTTHDVSGEQLALYRRDPAALIDELTRQDGTIALANGQLVPRLPNRVFWLDDSEFCGSINLRYAAGTDALPPHVHGHIWLRGGAVEAAARLRDRGAAPVAAGGARMWAQAPTNHLR